MPVVPRILPARMSKGRAPHSIYLPDHGPVIAPEGFHVLGVLEHGAGLRPPPAPEGAPTATLAMQVLAK